MLAQCLYDSRTENQCRSWLGTQTCKWPQEQPGAQSPSVARLGRLCNGATPLSTRAQHLQVAGRVLVTRGADCALMLLVSRFTERFKAWCGFGNLDADLLRPLPEILLFHLHLCFHLALFVCHPYVHWQHATHLELKSETWKSAETLSRCVFRYPSRVTETYKWHADSGPIILHPNAPETV